MNYLTATRNLISLTADEATAASEAASKAASAAIRTNEFLTLHRVANILLSATKPDTISDDYYRTTDDQQEIMAAEMGMDDGWKLALPRFRSDDTSTQANAYRTAYIESAADRATSTLYQS
jgi:hypothetical protein